MEGVCAVSRAALRPSDLPLCVLAEGQTPALGPDHTVSTRWLCEQQVALYVPILDKTGLPAAP